MLGLRLNSHRAVIDLVSWIVDVRTCVLVHLGCINDLRKVVELCTHVQIELDVCCTTYQNLSTF